MITKNKPAVFDQDNIPIEEYESLARKFIPGYDGLYSLAEVLLAENSPENANILIVGAGGGKEIVTFGKAFPGAHLTGVDPSEKMLGVAHKAVEKAGLEARVSLQRGTVSDLPERQFDAASALLVMHFLKDDGAKLDFLQNVHRRLKPGAKFILADGCFEKGTPEFVWLLNVYTSHARLKGAPPEIIEQAVILNLSENVNPVSEKRELELLAETGFGDIKPFFQGLWFRAWTSVKS